jgi:type IV secretion system protein VirB1
MLPGMEMLACPNLAVSPEVMQHVVQVESGANPYAIGVVGGQLERQPRDLSEALATAQMLDAKGYNFSVGLAQVNRANLERYGLDSYRKAVCPCANLSAGARILADCYTSAHGNWPKAFSCYYSGNFTTGFRHGYVQKIYASIDRDPSKQAPISVTTRHSPPATPTADAVIAGRVDLKPVTVYDSRRTNYRVTLRSLAIDTTTRATVAAITTARRRSVSTMPEQVPSKTADSPDAGSPIHDGVFVPKVRGPDDPDISASDQPSLPTMQAGIASVDRGNTDLHREQRDAAFVF